MKYLLILLLLLIPFTVYGESHPEYSGLSNASRYLLTVDEHAYPVQYEVDAQILAMAIDPELTSLLIGLENTKDSLFVIDLEHELINAQNNEFAILVNGYEVDYDAVSDADSTTLSFYVPEFTEEVEIIGTHVIPEFPFGVIMGFVLLVSTVTVFSRKASFRL